MQKIDKFVCFAEVRPPTLLRLRTQDEVNFVQFPQVNGKVSGYVQMKSGTEKKPRKACVRMVNGLIFSAIQSTKLNILISNF